MALVLLAAVSYHCAATWRWLRSKARGDDGGAGFLGRQPEPPRSEYVQDPKDPKKVLRQTTLPSVPTRHQTFQRQLSHRLDLPNIQFSVCSLGPRPDTGIGLIKPELYKKEMMARQSSTDSSSTEMEYCGKLHFALRYDQDIEGLIVKVRGH
ncbi:synaptotagmin-10-like [Schistocerca americana]|uniref:synaptotagmin-10-like n=1 Tax=Schistocerca americana TaxID=7009 RepID=UPI001F50193C|nr:synaptotagmin-10-like [Schistocerca americana]